MKLRRLYQLVTKRSRAVAFLPALVSGCSPLGLLDAVVPDGDYQRQAGIVYGDLPRQKLDVYRPNFPAEDAPVIVFFYGGSWKSGERGKYRFVADALTQRGYTVIIPDYRLYPQARFPAFMNDAARAVRWTAENIRLPDGRKPSLFLAGHSAGAHIAALLSADRQYLRDAGVPAGTICGVIGLAGPYAFDPLRYRSTRAVFADLETTDPARPVKQVAKGQPPYLLLHGDGDTTVRPSNTVEFANALKSSGNSVDTVILPDIGHYRIILAVARPFDDIAPVNDRITAFIDSHRDCR